MNMQIRSWLSFRFDLRANWMNQESIKLIAQAAKSTSHLKALFLPNHSNVEFVEMVQQALVSEVTKKKTKDKKGKKKAKG